jgi:hypothetical protein
MKSSELIMRLQDLQYKNGDQEVGISVVVNTSTDENIISLETYASSIVNIRENSQIIYLMGNDQ